MSNKTDLQAWLLGDAPAPNAPSGGGDGINAPDAPPTPTPTDAQVAEAAEHLRMADTEVGAPVPDTYVEGILRRLGLPVNAPTIEATKAAARSGAPAVAPAPAEATPADVAPAPAPPADDGEPRAAALAIAEAMRSAIPPKLILSIAAAKTTAREATGWRSVSSKRWAAVVAYAEAGGLWLAPEGAVGVPPDVVADLGALGWPPVAVAGMLPEVRAAVAEAGTRAEGMRVNPAGDVVAKAPPNDGPADAHLDAIVEKGLDAAARFAREDGKPPAGALTPPPLPTMPTIDAAATVARADAAVADATPAPEVEAPGPFDPRTLANEAADRAALAGAVAEARAPVPEAPRPALPFPVVIFVGCLPVGIAVDMTLATLTGPFERAVEIEAGVSYYGLMPYGQGPKGVASALRAHLYSLGGSPMWRTIYVDPAHPCAAEALPVLSQLPGALVVRS